MLVRLEARELKQHDWASLLLPRVEEAARARSWCAGRRRVELLFRRRVSSREAPLKHDDMRLHFW